MQKMSTGHKGEHNSMNNREFEVKQELLNDIATEFAAGHQDNAFSRLCWFCNGLLGRVKDLEDALKNCETKEHK